MKKLNKEFGSDFHWINYSSKFNLNLFPERYSLYSTGRDAIKKLLLWGKSSGLFKRIWMPTYYCPHVTKSILTTGIDYKFYTDYPWLKEFAFDEIDFEKGDIFLFVNYFGMRSERSFNFEEEIFLLEDHTHSPFSIWANESNADWCFASLRKTLPIPDGGILWSKDKELPPEPELKLENVIRFQNKLIGMLLKNNYLKGESVEKDDFRRYLVEGEKKMDEDIGSGISEYSKKELFKFPIEHWQNIKKTNFYALVDILKDNNSFDILLPRDREKTTPFSLIILFTSKQLKDKVRSGLIENNIYPAVLWDIDGPNDSLQVEKDYAERMISVHCDMRYTIDDMNYIGSIINGLTHE